MIANIGAFAAASVHPSMVKPAAPTNDLVSKYLATLGAAPAAAPSVSL